MHHFSTLIGKLGDFILFWIILISSRVFAVILIRSFCACVRVPDASMWFPTFFSAWFGASITDFFELFLGILTHSHLFVGLYESLDILCARVHPSDDVGHTLGSLLRGQPLGTYFFHGVGIARTFQHSWGRLGHTFTGVPLMTMPTIPTDGKCLPKNAYRLHR